MQQVNVAGIQGLESKALMLTADQSLIEIHWSVQYRINDPVQYLFQVRDPQLTLGQSGETALREVVARYDMPALLTGDARGHVTGEARGRIQQAMDAYRAGITVTNVNMTDVQLPDAALSTQRDAEKAAEDRQRAIADAQAYANDILPKAQAAAQHQLADAQVYAAQTVANARRRSRALHAARRRLRAGAGSDAQPPLHRYHADHPVALAQDRHRRQEWRRQHDLSAARQARRGGTRRDAERDTRRQLRSRRQCALPAAAGAGPAAGADDSERSDQPERGRERGDR